MVLLVCKKAVAGHAEGHAGELFAQVGRAVNTKCVSPIVASARAALTVTAKVVHVPA